jgi:hypothetical protein
MYYIYGSVQASRSVDDNNIFVHHASLVPSPIPVFSTACNIEKTGIGLGMRLHHAACILKKNLFKFILK